LIYLFLDLDVHNIFHILMNMSHVINTL